MPCSFEWNGDWSDASALWTPAFKAEVCPNASRRMRMLSLVTSNATLALPLQSPAPLLVFSIVCVCVCA